MLDKINVNSSNANDFSNPKKKKKLMMYWCHQLVQKHQEQAKS